MIWLVGILALGCVIVAASVAHGWARQAVPEAVWDIPRLSQVFPGIVSTLAGFTVASTTFLAGQAAARGAASFELLIAMFLIAFLVLISCAMAFASVPTATASGERAARLRTLQKDVYLIAVLAYALGINVAWLALRPLLLVVGLQMAADLFTWLLLVAVVGSGARIAMALRRSQGTSRSTRLVLLALGLGGPIVYRALSLTVAPGLWPAENAAFDFAIGAFLIGAVAFGLQTFLVSEYDTPIIDRWLIVGHRVLLGLASATVTIVTFVWLGVAAAT
jgi:hypothetical protein